MKKGFPWAVGKVGLLLRKQLGYGTQEVGLHRNAGQSFTGQQLSANDQELPGPTLTTQA